MKKRFFSILLALFVLVAAFPVGARAATDTIPTESTTLPSDPMVGTTTAAPVTPGGDENSTIPTP